MKNYRMHSLMAGFFSATRIETDSMPSYYFTKYRKYVSAEKFIVDRHSWARGYITSTVGRDKQVIREWIQHQEDEDRRVDQLELI